MDIIIFGIIFISLVIFIYIMPSKKDGNIKLCATKKYFPREKEARKLCATNPNHLNTFAKSKKQLLIAN